MKRIIWIAVMAFTMAAAFGQSAVDVNRTPSRVDRSRFHIGGYYLMKYATDEAHIRDVRDCGLDFISCIEADNPSQMRDVLNLFDKYGLAAYIGCWPHPRGLKAGTFHESWPLDKIRAKASKFSENGYEDYPSFQGGYAGDEPSAKDFPHLGKAIALERELMPDVLPYLNLYPNYATAYEDSPDSARSQLGCRNYKEYIDLYCRYIPLDYISYDFYLYGPPDEHLLPKMYSNYQIVADACRSTGRSFWYIPQVNGRRSDEWTSENRLRFQAFSAMAFGCESINWACYCAGWWSNQVLDREGNKTQQYWKLKKVNGEIRMMASKYMRFKNVGTDYVGFDSQTNALALITEKSSVRTLDVCQFKGLCADDGLALLVGTMEPRNGDARARALFVCAADDPFDKAHKMRTVKFHCESTNVRAFGANGKVDLKRRDDGAYAFQIESCAGVLIVAD